MPQLLFQGATGTVSWLFSHYVMGIWVSDSCFVMKRRLLQHVLLLYDCLLRDNLSPLGLVL